MNAIGPWRLPWERVSEAAETPEWCEVVDADGCTVTLLLDLELDNTDAIAAVDTLLGIVNHYPALLTAARAVVETATVQTKDLVSDNPQWQFTIPVALLAALRAAVETATGEE